MVREDLYTKLTPRHKSTVNKINLANKGLSQFPLYFGNMEQGSFIFRATSFLPENGILAKEHVQYPPQKNASIGRCNYNNQPIFYASNTAYGALLEKSACFCGISKESERVFLSRWKVVTNPIWVVDFFLKTIKEKTNPELKKLITARQAHIKNQQKDHRSIIEDLAFCGDCFAIEGEEAYPFTSIISNQLYKQEITGHHISGIQFIGAKADLLFQGISENYTNVALIPELVINKSIVLMDVIEIITHSKIGSELEIVSATEQTETINNQIKLTEYDHLPSKRQREILSFVCMNHTSTTN